MQSSLVGNDQLLELVESIWTSMLGLTVAPVAGASIVHDEAGLTACVQITGTWTGAVLFIATEQLARRTASLMLSTPAAEIRPADMQDGVAELCNIIGGSIKGLLPGPSSLSLPTVMHGSQYALHLPRTRLVAQLKFASDGQPAEVRVLQGCDTARDERRHTDHLLAE